MRGMALKYAGDEAKAARCAGIGTEHLLLGLVREENGTAGVVLREGGIRTDELRRLVENLIGGGRAEKNAAAVYTPRAELALRTASEQAEYFLCQKRSEQSICSLPWQGILTATRPSCFTH